MLSFLMTLYYYKTTVVWLEVKVTARSGQGEEVWAPRFGTVHSTYNTVHIFCKNVYMAALNTCEYICAQTPVAHEGNLTKTWISVITFIWHGTAFKFGPHVGFYSSELQYTNFHEWPKSRTECAQAVLQVVVCGECWIQNFFAVDHY